MKSQNPVKLDEMTENTQNAPNTDDLLDQKNEKIKNLVNELRKVKMLNAELEIENSTLGESINGLKLKNNEIVKENLKLTELLKQQHPTPEIQPTPQTQTPQKKKSSVNDSFELIEPDSLTFPESNENENDEETDDECETESEDDDEIEIQKLEVKVMELEKIIRQKDIKIKEMKKKAENMAEKNANEKKDVEEDNKDKEIIDGLKSEIVKLKSEVDTLKGEIDKNTKEYNEKKIEHEQKCKSMAEKMSKLVNENSTMAEKIGKSSTDLLSEQEKNKKLLKKISQSVEQMDFVRSNLKNSDNLMKQINEITEINEKIQKENELLKNELTVKENEIIEHVKAEKLYKETMHKMNENGDETDVINENKVLKEEDEKNKSTIMELEEKIKGYEEGNGDIVTKEELEESTNALEEFLKESKAKNDDLENLLLKAENLEKMMTETQNNSILEFDDSSVKIIDDVSKIVPKKKNIPSTTCPIIIEFDSSCIKVGFGGEENPRVSVFPVISSDNLLIGHDALSSGMDIRYIIGDDDNVVNINDFQTAILIILKSEEFFGKNISLNGILNTHPLYILDGPNNSLNQNLKIDFINMFHNVPFECPSYFIINKISLLIQHNNINTALFVTTTHHNIYFIPIINSVIDYPNVVTHSFGDKNINEYMMYMIQRENENVNSEINLDNLLKNSNIMNDIRESLAYVTMNSFEDERKKNIGRSKVYKITNECEIKLNKALYMPYELWFNDEKDVKIYSMKKSIVQVIRDVICNGAYGPKKKIKKNMVQNIFLMGKNLNINGMKKKISSLLKKSFAQNENIKKHIKVKHVKNSIHSPWKIAQNDCINDSFDKWISYHTTTTTKDDIIISANNSINDKESGFSWKDNEDDAEVLRIIRKNLEEANEVNSISFESHDDDVLFTPITPDSDNNDVKDVKKDVKSEEGGVVKKKKKKKKKKKSPKKSPKKKEKGGSGEEVVEKEEKEKEVEVEVVKEKKKKKKSKKDDKKDSSSGGSSGSGKKDGDDSEKRKKKKKKKKRKRKKSELDESFEKLEENYGLKPEMEKEKEKEKERKSDEGKSKKKKKKKKKEKKEKKIIKKK